MQQGGDNAAPQKGDMSLIAACRRGQLDQIKDALRRGVDVNCRGRNRMTPLMAAAETGRLDIMKFLVENGADPTLVSDAGQNVLHLASMRGDGENVQYILSLGRVNINAMTNDGLTAIDWASKWNRKEVKNILLSQDAEPSQMYPDE